MRYLLLSLLVLPAGSRAQSPTDKPVTWNAATTPSASARALPVSLTATIASGWHIYALTQGKGGPVPMRVLLDRGQGVLLDGPMIPPRARVTFDSTFGIRTESYAGKPSFTIPLRSIAAGPRDGFNIRVRYQACSSTLCLPARTESVPVRIANPKR